MRSLLSGFSRGLGSTSGLALRSLVVSCATASVHIDRDALSRHFPVLAVEVAGSRCASLLREIRPHVLRLRSMKPVRLGSSEDFRLVLLDASLQTEDALPPQLQQAIESAGGKCQHVDVRLGYEDLTAREVLTELLPAGVTVPTGYESVGHVVHLNLRSEQLAYRHLIGQVLLDKLGPRVRTVVNKPSEIQSRFRTTPLELIAGEADFHVSVQHGDARLAFDYSKVYWSSRLHTEHERMAAAFRRGELVWDLCAGVGPFAVLAARRGVDVLANDLNPDACAAMRHNAHLNRVLPHMHVYNMDAVRFVEAAAASMAGRAPGLAAARFDVEAVSDPERAQLAAHADQLEARPPDHVLLNLPADSMTLLPALRTLHGTAAAPLVHCYTFSKLAGAEEQRCEAHRRVAAHLGHAPAHVDVRAIRSVAPGKEYLCYTFGLQ